MESYHMRKGQASIEFILLMAIMLLFINTAIIANSNAASDAALDVSRLGKARLGAERLVDAINYVGLGAEGTKQTVSIFIPQGATITCIPGTGSSPFGKISFTVDIKGIAPEVNGCSVNPLSPGNSTCSKSMPVYSTIALSCNTSITGPSVQNYEIVKGAGYAVDVS